MGRGRQTKYSEEFADAICALIASGVPEYIAAQSSGINRDTLSQWKRDKPDFSDKVKRARAAAVAVRVARIEKAARGGDEIEVSEKTIKHKDGKIERIIVRKKTPPAWTADAWYLERQFCEQFGLNRIDLKELIKLLRESKSTSRGGRSASNKG